MYSGVIYSQLTSVGGFTQHSAVLQCGVQMLYIHLSSLFHLAPLLHWMRCCRLHTPSRENQVQPEVFEMVNATGNSVSCSPSEYSSHRLCLCVAVCTHTGTWLIILGTACRIIFSTDSPGWTLLILCYVWVGVHVCERVWMQLGATYSVFALVISLEPDCHPICLRVGTLGNPAMFSCAALALFSTIYKHDNIFTIYYHWLCSTMEYSLWFLFCSSE